jgi:hypothetical protein
LTAFIWFRLSEDNYLVPGKGAAKATTTTNLRPLVSDTTHAPAVISSPSSVLENGQIGMSRRDPGGPRDKAVVQTYAVQGRILTEQILGDQTV